jgi:hypothetical protein
MLDMTLTFAVFQAARFWLKTVAELNIEFMLLTLAVFQLAMFWLNAAAELNIEYIDLTLATFQLPISTLKVVPLKTESNEVTLTTLQPPMS